jgi:hypothetical protein
VPEVSSSYNVPGKNVTKVRIIIGEYKEKSIIVNPYTSFLRERPCFWRKLTGNKLIGNYIQGRK